MGLIRLGFANISQCSSTGIIRVAGTVLPAERPRVIPAANAKKTASHVHRGSRIAVQGICEARQGYS